MRQQDSRERDEVQVYQHATFDPRPANPQHAGLRHGAFLRSISRDSWKDARNQNGLGAGTHAALESYQND